MLRKRLLAVLLTAAMLVSLMPNMAFAATDSNNVLLTRGEVVDMLLKSANHYKSNLQKTDIIKGYDSGDSKENQPVTRVETFAMVSRAFGLLPTPVGNDKRIGLTYSGFIDVPAWAQSDIDNLGRAGVIAGTSAKTLSSKSNVTRGQLTAVIHRIWALEGTNVSDDFYNAVNKKFLDSSIIPQGQATNESFATVSESNSDRISDIIKDLLSKQQEAGSNEQKISDFYRSVADTDSRNAQGIKPIKKYLDSIDKVTDLTDLNSVQSEIRDATGVSGLLSFDLNIDQKDSTKYILEFSAIDPTMPKEFYSEDNTKKSIYIDYLTTVMKLCGESNQKASKDANTYFNLEKTIAQKEMSAADSSNIENSYNVFTPEQMQNMFPTINIKKLIKDFTFSVPDKILISDVNATKAFTKYYSNDNIDILKVALKYDLLNSLSGTLSTDFQDAAVKLQKQYYGIEGDTSAEKKAMSITEKVMDDYLGKIFVDKYFSKEAKQDVTNMTTNFISIFKNRIQNLDWMSDSTKKMAIKKLDNMKVKIGYDDDWDNGKIYSNINHVDIVYNKGENDFFKNICEISKFSKSHQYTIQNDTVDRTQWFMSAFTVNAMYNPSMNDITFPAGILQSPFYDVKASKEQNLGGIGIVIAHEITHAFDNNGAKYDENGNLSNWWTKEDYAKFQVLCDKVAKFYDGYEVAPGIKTSGELTLSENIADNGGVACALDAMHELTNPDYKKFFESFASTWAMTSSRDYLNFEVQSDVHSPNKVRVNRTIVNFDEFYKTYGIKEGDGMYVAPEDRIKIW